MRSSSSLTVGERLCAAFFPFVALAEVVLFALADCLLDIWPHRDDAGCRDGSDLAARKRSYRAGVAALGFHDIVRLADESRCFSVNEVEALFELYKKISCSIINDGLIHKEELQLALFKTPSGENLFLDRAFLFGTR